MIPVRQTVAGKGKMLQISLFLAATRFFHLSQFPLEVLIDDQPYCAFDQRQQ
jgi:hypothetical protein